MRDKYDEILGYIARALNFVVIGILVLLMLQLCSCTRTVYVPQTTIERDSIYLTTHTRDSIWLHDSVLVREKGDTVWMERWHTKYIERLKVDTAYLQHTDTLRQPYPVEKQLSLKQRVMIGLGHVCVGLIVSIIAIFIFILLKRRRI